MTVTRQRVALVVALVAAVAGAIDAAIGRVWDQLAVLAVVVALLLYVLWPRARSVLTARPDLARWLRTRAAIGAEPTDALVDRVVVTYRDHLSDPPPDVVVSTAPSEERTVDGARSAR